MKSRFLCNLTRPRAYRTSRSILLVAFVRPAVAYHHCGHREHCQVIGTNNVSSGSSSAMRTGTRE